MSKHERRDFSLSDFVPKKSIDEIGKSRDWKVDPSDSFVKIAEAVNKPTNKKETKMSNHEVYGAEFEGVFCNAHTRGFRITWDSDIGFGQFDFYIETNNNNKLVIDNECMSREFIKQVLCELVDSAILDCEKRE